MHTVGNTIGSRAVGDSWRLIAVVVAAAVVGGVGGAALELAIRDTSGSSATTAGATTPVAAQAPAPGGSLTPEAIYARDAPGVVVVTATQTQPAPSLFGPPAEQRVSSLGSGFVIDAKGDVVTNQHVVGNASDVRVGLAGGASYPAKVLGTDPSTDVAVLRVDAPASALHPLAFADIAGVHVGDPVYAIGNPFGLERTMTAGIVSATGRDITAPNGLGIPNAIQTDAPINHGNSGGPLLDRYGRVIGINDQIDSGGTVNGNVGVGFAVPASTAASISRQLIAAGHVTHAFLGVQVTTISPDVATLIKGLPARGVLVTSVVPGSPAAKAGLEAGHAQLAVNGQSVPAGGDAIVAVNGTPVTTAAELAAAVASHRPGDSIRLDVVGPHGKRTVTVALGNAPAAG